MFELKTLTREAIPAALEKAMRYRLLNEPEQAESICEDVLRIDPDNQEAITTLILALTDRLYGPRPVSAYAARELARRLHGEYDREYYAGIIDEREGIARLRNGTPRCGPIAYECFRRAMAHFERAESIRPPGNDDAILRWNSCARMIMAYPDVAPADETIEVAADLGE
jgi:tetratricopeptide (TPR) repeat protein